MSEETRRRLNEAQEQLSLLCRDLQHAIQRAEELGDREVPAWNRQRKRDIIDRYNDDIYAMSKRKWALESEIEDLMREAALPPTSPSNSAGKGDSPIGDCRFGQGPNCRRSNQRFERGTAAGRSCGGPNRPTEPTQREVYEGWQ